MSRKVKVRFAKLWLLSVVLLAIFAPFIANEKPLFGNDTLTSNDNSSDELGNNSNTLYPTRPVSQNKMM